MIFNLNLFKEDKVMLRKSVWIGLLLLVVFLPSTLLARGMMHGKWWNDKSIVKELNLTDSEKKEIDEKYTESRRRMIELKYEIEKQRFELDILLGTQDADKQKILERFDSLEQARKNLSKARFEMLLEVRETIGAERFQELKGVHRDRGRKDAGRNLQDRPYSKERGRD
jgi:Spy/CpxP family protein refolding chaperone